MENKYDAIMEKFDYGYLVGKGTEFPTPEMIRDAERELGTTLPDDYKEFLAKYGFAVGGRSISYGTVYDPLEPETSVNSFYGIQPDTDDDLVETKRGRDENTNIDPRFLPIARSECGDIVMSLYGDDKGWIYLRPGEWLGLGNEDVELIAYNFDQFMHLLRPGPRDSE